jgi:hypothetical protein
MRGTSSIAHAISMNGSARKIGALVFAFIASIMLMVSAASAWATLSEGSFAEKTEGQPALSVSGEVLHWSAEDPTGAYLLRRTVPGRETEYALVKAAHARPPAIASATVGYRVRGLLEKYWSPETSIAYEPLPLEPTLLGGLTESSFFERNEERSALLVRGKALNWEATDPTGAYLLKRMIPGAEAEYALVKSTHARPPVVPNTTVSYRVKGVLSRAWSPEVSLSYAASEVPEEEAEAETEAPEAETEAPEAEAETPEAEGPATSASRAPIVNGAPTGPRTPEGGWHVAFADGFGSPLGTEPGQDNFVYPNQNACCNPFEDRHGNNTNELQVYNGSQVRVGSEGLELIDKYSPQRAPAEGFYPVRNYVSGSISTQSQYAAGGWRPFTWKPGGGKTWAFECNCRLPANSPFAGVDPGWWSTDVKWTNEIDFFEEWGWGSGCQLALLTSCLTGAVWIYDTSPLTVEESYMDLYSMFDPSSGFHRYTTVIYPDNTWSLYIDGQRQGWVGVNGVAPAPPYFEKTPMGLLLTNALRDKTATSGPNPYPGFSSGTRTFTIRSIAVYDDAAHAGQDVSGGGVAPGTTIG